MPIGSGATYVDANLQSAPYYHEDEFPILMQQGPLRPVMENGIWPASCGGGTQEAQARIPDGYLVEPGGGGYYPNNAAGVLLEDGRTVLEFQYAARCSGTGPMYAGAVRCSLDIYGSGIGCFAAHGGSGLSGVGGSLRVWEVNGTGAIAHALKLTMPSHTLSNCNNGYRWPAIASDSGFDETSSSQYYAGSNCNLRMGSLLAVPPSVNCNTLVSSTLGRRLCKTFQDYGAYVVDVHPSWNTGCQCPRTDWRPLTINGEIGTGEVLYTIDDQIITIFQELQVVSNNASGTVGGGGTPRAPLAPPIGN